MSVQSMYHFIRNSVVCRTNIKIIIDKFEVKFTLLIAVKYRESYLFIAKIIVRFASATLDV